MNWTGAAAPVREALLVGAPARRREALLGSCTGGGAAGPQPGGRAAAEGRQ